MTLREALQELAARWHVPCNESRDQEYACPRCDERALCAFSLEDLLATPENCGIEFEDCDCELCEDRDEDDYGDDEEHEDVVSP